ncbi:MAG TPA: hypothetical protein VEF72_21230 [Mycobacterium sp.]|nr:hypothetical protein [Mycobacterium sp.]
MSVDQFVPSAFAQDAGSGDVIVPPPSVDVCDTPRNIGSTPWATPPAVEYVTFACTDAHGRQWRRTGSGQPVRVFD